MYPNQPQPPTPPPVAPVDYLNQISPQTQKTPFLKPGPKLFLLIGLALVVLVSAVAITINVIVSAQRAPLQRLAARMATIQTIAENAQSNLKSSQLRGLNSNLQLYFTNTSRDLGTPLTNNGVDPANLPGSISSDEAGDAIALRLEDARLNAVFDRTYAREMTFALSNLLTLMRQIYNSTSSASMKEFLEKAIINLEPTQESFSSFSS